MSYIYTHASRLDEAQGASEERTELYLTYSEGVPQLATQRFAKNSGRVDGSAVKQATVARRVCEK